MNDVLRRLSARAVIPGMGEAVMEINRSGDRLVLMACDKMLNLKTQNFDGIVIS